MSWITDLFTDIGTYGREFIDPENLAKSLGTAGVMSLFGGNSDDFARNFLMTNLGRTIGGVRKGKETAKSLNAKFSALSPAEQQKYLDVYDSGQLSKQDFKRFSEMLGDEFTTYEDYKQQTTVAPLASMKNVTPPSQQQPYQSPYGPAMNASYTPASQVPISSGNQVAEVVTYDVDPSGIGIRQTTPSVAAGSGFQTEDLGGGFKRLYSPETGAEFISDGAGGFRQINKAAKKAPGFGEGIGYFADRLEKYPQIAIGEEILKKLNPDYFEKRDFQQEAEDRDKRLRNQFRQETLNPARSGFSRNMRARRYASGGIADLQSGGAANGPGTGTSDSIPARLSDGEFVMTAEAVRNMGNGSREKGTRKMYELMNNLERRM
tara:strand:- start:3707 stop:4837 length:1131 start_codon:yes stop_codon:yes gene_type:complete